MHKAVLIEAADEFPITLAEANEHLKVSGEDAYVNTLIAAATGQIERYLKRALITQQWSLYLDCWEDKILLPYPTLQSVESIEYFDINGEEQTLDEELYWVSNTTDPGSVTRRYDVVYPELQYGRPDSARIDFTCGWADAEAVPSQIKHAIKIYLTDLHEHRGEIVTGLVKIDKIPNHVLNLIHDFRIYNF